MENVPAVSPQSASSESPSSSERWQDIDETGGHRPSASIVTVAKVVYALHAVSIVIGIATGASIVGAFLFGWPSIAAVVLNYVMRSEARGTYVDSHFSWQIRTFWYAMVWAILVGIVGFFLSFVVVGFFVWIAGFVVMGIWVAYRIIRGWIRLANGEMMPD